MLYNFGGLNLIAQDGSNKTPYELTCDYNTLKMKKKL